MHCELVVPALFTAPAPHPVPALELLLGRGRKLNGEAASLERWLCRVFGLKDGSIPAGALTALALGENPGAHFWLRADPVHLRLLRERMVLIPSHAFSLTLEEARSMADTLNRQFAGEFKFHALRPDAWCAQGEQDIAVGSDPPVELAGQDVDANLPDKRWHALLNEIQMALHEHAVNATREVPVNSLWLWGGGWIPAAAKGPWQSVSADDPVALGLARLAGMRHRAPGAGAEEWLARAPEDGRHLVVLDGLRGVRALGDADALGQRLRSLEERWFAPLLAALKAGSVAMVSVHVPDAAACFETVRGDLRRFWRRALPLAAYGGDAA